MNDKNLELEQTTPTQTIEQEPTETRLTYEAPHVMKKRSVAKVTLFSGGGASAGGLTAAG